MNMEICCSVFRTLEVPFLKVLLPKISRKFDKFFLSSLKSSYLMKLLTRKHQKVCQRFPVFSQTKILRFSGTL